MRAPFAWLVVCLMPFCGCETGVMRMVDDVRVKTRIGVLAHPEIAGVADTKILGKALRFYREAGVKAVVFCGAVTKNGSEVQQALFNVACQEVFGGSSVKLIAADGWHEVDGFSFAVAKDRPAADVDVLTFLWGRKLSLTDELCLYPLDSRLVCAGSLHGVEVPEGIEGSGVRSRASRAAQGLLVSVYGDRTVIRRLDFSQSRPTDPKAFAPRDYVEDVAKPWVVDAQGVAAEPETEPVFWPDARVRVVPGRAGHENILTVKWPNVSSDFCGARARWYEVGLASAENPKAVLSRKVVMSNGFFLSEERDRQGVSCVFKESELPPSAATRRQVVFTVTPVGCFGKPGTPITSAPVPLR